MGRRGPKPAPTALKIAAGVRADRVNMDSPTGPPGDPEPPSWLAPDQRAAWDQAIPLVREMGACRS